MVDFFVILFLLVIGVFLIVFAGALFGADDKSAIFPVICGVILIACSLGITCETMEEVSIRRFVNDELTYDTVLVDKTGRLIEIKVIKN